MWQQLFDSEWKLFQTKMNQRKARNVWVDCFVLNAGKRGLLTSSTCCHCRTVFLYTLSFREIYAIISVSKTLILELFDSIKPMKNFYPWPITIALDHIRWTESYTLNLLLMSKWPRLQGNPFHFAVRGRLWPPLLVVFCCTRVLQNW